MEPKRTTKQVDAIYGDFVKAVARGRAVSTVLENFGRGRTMMAADAMRAGLIDDIGDLNTAIAYTDGSKVRAARLALLKRAGPDAQHYEAAAARKRRLQELRNNPDADAAATRRRKLQEFRNR